MITCIAIRIHILSFNCLFIISCASSGRRLLTTGAGPASVNRGVPTALDIAGVIAPLTAFCIAYKSIIQPTFAVYSLAVYK